MKNLNNKLQTHLKLQGTRVRLPWATEIDALPKWNETCAIAIEKFGFAGDRYQTHATEDYMDFYFKDERDAILFQLMM